MKKLLAAGIAALALASAGPALADQTIQVNDRWGHHYRAEPNVGFGLFFGFPSYRPPVVTRHYNFYRYDHRPHWRHRQHWQRHWQHQGRHHGRHHDRHRRGGWWGHR